MLGSYTQITEEVRARPDPAEVAARHRPGRGGEARRPGRDGRPADRQAGPRTPSCRDRTRTSSPGQDRRVVGPARVVGLARGGRSGRLRRRCSRCCRASGVAAGRVPAADQHHRSRRSGPQFERPAFWTALPRHAADLADRTRHRGRRRRGRSAWSSGGAAAARGDGVHHRVPPADPVGGADPAGRGAARHRHGGDPAAGRLRVVLAGARPGAARRGRRGPGRAGDRPLLPAGPVARGCATWSGRPRCRTR